MFHFLQVEAKAKVAAELYERENDAVLSTLRQLWEQRFVNFDGDFKAVSANPFEHAPRAERA